MNDTTYLATALDAHRAADLVREVELIAQHAERDADVSPRPASVAGQAATPAIVVGTHRTWWLHRATRRTTFVATR